MYFLLIWGKKTNGLGRTVIILSLCTILGSFNGQKGQSWKRVGRKLKQIDSGPYGRVAAVDRYGRIFYRTGIRAKRPQGSSWRSIPGRLNYISVNSLGYWGTTRRHFIYFRKGVRRFKLYGMYFLKLYYCVTYTDRHYAYFNKITINN